MAETTVQPLKVEAVSMSSMLQIIASLAFVLLVFGAVVFLMRRVSGINPAAHGHMKIVDGLSLGTRDRLVLLQVGSEQVLLGISPGQIRTLHVMQESIDFSDRQPGENFSQKLKQAMSGKRSTASSAEQEPGPVKS